MTGRIAFLCVLFLTAAAPADPSADPEEVIKDRKALMPWRKHGAFKGKVVGVLVSDVAGFMGHEGRGGPPDAMGFSADGDSYRWTYVTVAEKALITDLKVEIGEKAGGKTKTYPKLSMANAAEVKRWGIDVPYALVEAEVNDGEGTPPGEGFVATKMTRLDGGKKYSLDVPAVIRAAKGRHAADLKKKDKAVARGIDAAAKEAGKAGQLTGPRQTQTVMYVSWLPANERLRVAFRTAVTDGAFRYIDRFGPRRGPGGGVARVKVGTGIEAELGWAYEFDRTGKLVRVQTLPLKVKAEELPPPP